ncbi:Rab family GTPase [Streptomyces qaidamensis]|uniref:Rab family GTPase n=1 Tax=Streptomyces qaidamensis TaxID=1783515 RepID=UPI00131A8213|nr:GTPase domain-containing protein [Streptomyces qaidamensis]
MAVSHPEHPVLDRTQGDSRSRGAFPIERATAAGKRQVHAIPDLDLHSSALLDYRLASVQRNSALTRSCKEQDLPLPVIVGAVVLSGVVGTALTVRQLKRPAKIILLGEGMSGKTTLLNTWQGKWDEPVHRTHPAGEFIGRIRLDTGKKVLWIDKPLKFRNVKDFSGMDEILDASRDGVEAAQYILYLIKAPQLETDEENPGASEAYERLIADAARIKRYSTKIKKVILVITFTDKDSRYELLGHAAYLTRVRGQLSDLISLLSMRNKTKVVAGSLATRESADLLAGEVVQAML